MTFGALEITIAAIIVVVLLIWWLWPKHDRGDLSAPPKDFTARQPVLPAEMTEAEPARPVEIAETARRGKVMREADYSEEDLMIRDVRALLHRGRKIEAVKRVRQTKNISLAEAHRFVENVDLPAGHGDD